MENNNSANKSQILEELLNKTCLTEFEQKIIYDIKEAELNKDVVLKSI